MGWMGNGRPGVVAALAVLVAMGATTGLAPGAAGAPARQAAAAVQVEVQVLQNPSPFVAGGRAHLLYELHVTNFQRAPLTLSAIEVAPADAGAAPLALFEGAELADMVVPVGATERPVDPLALAPGVRHLVFLALDFASMAEVPAALAHRLLFEPTAADAPPGVSVLPRVPVLSLVPAPVGPPVYGDGWAAINGASNTSNHRRTPLVVNGHLYFAQRYAVDLVQVDREGWPYRGDPARNESWLGYGAELLAVADGVVIEVRDGIPENVPGEPPVVPINLDTVAGNYVVLDIGNGRYAGYAHLIPGSLRVQPGDLVRRGQVLGRLGNSGNSTAPHLHFHITAGPSFLEADGVPYAFERVRVRPGRLVDEGDFFRVAGASVSPRAVVDELVLENDVLDFGQP